MRGGGQLGGAAGGVGGGGVLSRSYAVSAPADRDASQLLYYSYLIISIGEMGVWGAYGGYKGDLEGGLIIPNH